MTILAIPSTDPALPIPAPDADWYTLELNRRLRELLAQYSLLLEPLQRYKTDGQILTANDEESGGAEWATAAGGDIWRGNRIVYSAANSTTPTVVGDTWASSVGTNTYPALATTNLLTSTPRIVTTTAAGANSQAGYNGSLIWWRGNATGLGGFRVELEIGVATTQTTLRAVCGLAYNAGANISVAADPSAATDCVFLGCDAADTNMQIMHNNNAGTCTKIDLGSSFPKTANVYYRLTLTADANASTIDYTVERLDSAASSSGTISTDLPSSTNFMSAQVRFGNGSTASAAAGAWFRYLGEGVSP